MRMKFRKKKEEGRMKNIDKEWEYENEDKKSEKIQKR